MKCYRDLAERDPGFFVAVWRKISHGRLRGLNDKGVTFHPQKVNFSHDYRDAMPKSLALLCFLHEKKDKLNLDDFWLDGDFECLHIFVQSI